MLRVRVWLGVYWETEKLPGLCLALRGRVLARLSLSVDIDTAAVVNWEEVGCAAPCLEDKLLRDVCESRRAVLGGQQEQLALVAVGWHFDGDGSMKQCSETACFICAARYASVVQTLSVRTCSLILMLFMARIRVHGLVPGCSTRVAGLSR